MDRKRVKIWVIALTVLGFLAVSGFKAFTPKNGRSYTVELVLRNHGGIERVVRTWEVPTSVDHARIRAETHRRVGLNESEEDIVAWIDAEVKRANQAARAR